MHLNIMLNLVIVTALSILLSACSNSYQKPKNIQLIGLEYEPQLEIYSCGSAVLTSVINYWKHGKPIAEKTILNSYPPNDIKKGYSLGELKTISRSIGLNAFTLVMTDQQLKSHINKRRPIIVPLTLKPGDLSDSILKKTMTYSLIADTLTGEIDHFVIVIGYDNQGYYISSPNQSFIHISYDNFKQFWGVMKNAALILSS